MRPSRALARLLSVFAAAATLAATAAPAAEPPRHDVLHYRLVIAPDLATGEVHTDVELRVAVAPGAGPLALRLADAWRVEEARVGGRKAEPRRGPEQVELELPERAGEVAVTFPSRALPRGAATRTGRSGRAFNGFVGYSPAYLEKELARTGYDAHETSLLWWGYVTNGRGPGAFQWNEGLGDYVEVLYGEARGKPLPENFVRFRREYLAAVAATPEAEPARAELRGSTPQRWVHGKYPWLMGVLREAVGDAAFRRGLRLLFERHRFRTYAVEDLVAAMEEASGRSLAWWRDGWLERRGVPGIEVDWRAVRGPAGWRVEGTVRAGPELAEVPIELAARTARGEARRVVRAVAAETPFALELADEPVELVVDPRERLLVRKAVRGPPAAR